MPVIPTLEHGSCRGGLLTPVFRVPDEFAGPKIACLLQAGPLHRRRSAGRKTGATAFFCIFCTALREFLVFVRLAHSVQKRHGGGGNFCRQDTSLSPECTVLGLPGPLWTF